MCIYQQFFIKRYAVKRRRRIDKISSNEWRLELDFTWGIYKTNKEAKNNKKHVFVNSTKFFYSKNVCKHYQ